jgi:hypothetical protein
MKMKNYFLLWLCLLGHVALAQTESNEAFKEANTLVLTTTDSTRVALWEISECLATYGVRIRSGNITAHTTAETMVWPTPEGGKPLRLQSVPWAGLQSSKQAYVTYVVTVWPGPNCRLTLTGQVAATASMDQDVAPAAFTGREKGRPMAAFRLMEGAARQYVKLAKIRKKPALLKYVKQ